MRYYWADSQNQPVGPFDKDDLAKMMSASVIDPETFVCTEGGVEWVSLDSLMSGPPSSPPATTPPRPTPEMNLSDANFEKGANASVRRLFELEDAEMRQAQQVSQTRLPWILPVWDPSP